MLFLTEPQDYQSQTLQLFPVGEPEMIGKGHLAMGPKWEEETGMAIHLVVPCGSYCFWEATTWSSRVLTEVGFGFCLACTAHSESFYHFLCASSDWLVRKHVTANAHKKMIWLLNRKSGWMRSLLSKQTATKYLNNTPGVLASHLRCECQAFESHIFNPEVGTPSACRFFGVVEVGIVLLAHMFYSKKGVLQGAKRYLRSSIFVAALDFLRGKFLYGYRWRLRKIIL